MSSQLVNPFFNMGRKRRNVNVSIGAMNSQMEADDLEETTLFLSDALALGFVFLGCEDISLRQI